MNWISHSEGFTSDKELVKFFVKSVVGDEHNVETLAIIRTEAQLRSFDFPDRCCIKATHGSGWSYIRRHGEALPFDLLSSWLRTNFYDITRERNYRYLEPKIIVEPLVFDSDAVWDYKAFCYRGNFKLMAVDIDRDSSHKRAFLDRGWRLINIKIPGIRTDQTVEKPACFEEMISIAEKFAKFFDLIRVDFYTDGKKIFIGELTHCIGSACTKFADKKQEEILGTLIFEN